MVGERRRFRRFKRRMTVKFGHKDFTGAGVTADVSATGAFVISSTLPPLGSIVLVQLLDENQVVCGVAEVRHHRVVPPALRAVEKGGFGLRFLTPQETMAAVLPSGFPFEYAVRSQEELLRVYQEEIRRGGLFVPCERLPARDSEVSLNLHLEHLGHSVEARCRVLAVRNGESVPRGVSLGFVDGPALEKALVPLLEMKAAPQPAPRVGTARPGEPAPVNGGVTHTAGESQASMHRSMPLPRAPASASMAAAAAPSSTSSSAALKPTPAPFARTWLTPRGKKCFEIRYPSADVFRRAVADEFRLGGIFIRTEAVAAHNEEVQVEMVLEFAERRLIFPARVMQRLDSGQGFKGLASAFLDAAAVNKAVAEFAK